MEIEGYNTRSSLDGSWGYQEPAPLWWEPVQLDELLAELVVKLGQPPSFGDIHANTSN